MAVAHPTARQAKIAVTGSTGFIGSHLVPALLANRFRVMAIAKQGLDTGREGLETFASDIRSGEGLNDAFAGVEAVIHLAARCHIFRETDSDPLAAYRVVNVKGTSNVAQAASAVGARLFVHVSSIAAMGGGSEAIQDECSPCSPETPYGTSKLESEAVVRAVSAETGMRVVILRLPMAYGPSDKGNLPRLIRWAERGLPCLVFRPENMRSMIYVENVVAGILAVLNDVREESATYILKDREDCSSRTLFAAICRELNRQPVFLPIPSPLVRLGGMLSDDFRKLTGSFRVSAAKAEREIGFISPFSLEEGIARTVRWYRNSVR